ncbi:MAG: hypothetical protein NXI24_20895 [bacterium]|nr:hypothetical protein [bacterium]
MIRMDLVRRTAAVLFVCCALPVFGIVGCSSSPPPTVDKPVAKETPPRSRICVLDEVRQAFVCDMDFQVSAGKSCASGPGLDLEHEFLTRMTMVSLETLYLEGEAGARPPFRYNSPGEVYARIQRSDCSGDANAGTCSCRFTYQDPELLQIFYHSAGCRRSSSLSGNPLYFRGHGCY